MNPADDALCPAIVVLCQGAALHGPTESQFNHPSAWQNVKAFGTFDSSHDLNFEFRPQITRLLFEFRATRPAIAPQLSQPSEATQCHIGQLLGAVAFGDIIWNDQCSQQMPQSIRKDEALPPFGLLSGVVAGLSREATRANRLPIENGRSRATSMPMLLSVKGAKPVVDGRQGIILNTGSEDDMNGAARRNILREESLMTSGLIHIQDRIGNPALTRRRTPRFGQRRKHGLKKFPLIVNDIGAVGGIFDRIGGHSRGISLLPATYGILYRKLSFRQALSLNH